MAFIRHRPERDRPWEVNWRDPAGKQRARSFRRKGDAQRHKTEIEGELLHGEYVDPRLGKTRFQAWAEETEAGRLGRRESTRVRDRHILDSLILPTFERRAVASIQPGDVQRWVADLDRAGYAPSTVRKAYEVCSRIMTAAADRGLIVRTPCRGIHLPTAERTEMKFITAEQVASLAEVIDPRWRVLVLTAAYTGLRWGELAGLRLPQVDLLHRSLQVVEALSEVQGTLTFGQPKTNSSRRSVTLPPFLVDELAAHMVQGLGELVFTGPDGGPLRRTNFRRRVWMPATEAASLEGLRFHDLRHSHAAMLIGQGTHPKVIQARLGHSSIRTTLDTYGHLFEGLDAAAASALDTVFREARADSGLTRGLPTVVQIAR